MIIKNTLPSSQEEGSGDSPKKMSLSTLFLSALLTLAICITMVFSIRNQYEEELDKTYEMLANSVYSLRNLITFEDSLQDSYESLDIREAKVITDVISVLLEYFGVTENSLTEFSRLVGARLFYYPDKGRVLASQDAEVMALGKSQMRMLKRMGILRTGGHEYSACAMEGGWLFVEWDDVLNLYSVDFQRIMETTPSELCVIDNVTGEVLTSSTMPPYDFMDADRIIYDEERTAHKADGIQAGYFDGDSLFNGLYFERVRLLNHYSVFVYRTLGAILNDALWKVAPVYILMLLSFLFIFISARRMWETGKSMKERKDCQRFGRNRYINLPVMRHVLPLLLLGVLAMTVISAYLPLLNNYTSHNARMERILSSFISEMELADEEWAKMDVPYSNMIKARLEAVSSSMARMGKDFTPEYLDRISSAFNFDSMTVYDENGVSVMSTDGYLGYKISEDPDDDEHVLWDLLKNADVTIMNEFSDKSGFYAATRRLDEPGLIYAKKMDTSVLAMKEQTDVSAALLRCNTETYAKMYASPAAPDTFLWAKATDTAVREIENKCPETVLMNRYCGLQTINGYRYYLNTMSNENHAFISVEQNEVFMAPIKGILRWTVTESILIALFIFLTCCTYPCMSGWLETETAKQYFSRLLFGKGDSTSPDERKLESLMRKGRSRLLWQLCAALVILYAIDTLFSGHPTAAYLFSHQWQREPSIFSVTTIVLSILFLALGTGALKAALKAMSDMMDSRTETFGNLVVSIIQFFLTILVAIYALYELGVNTSVILTSAGVLSIVIGYGSQSIISDLMSGVFLIMEDQIRIGEFIEIDGFLGVVEHIGLRTTRASYLNREKVVSNSQMVGFYNLSRDMTAADWTIGFPVGQDLEEVKSLIVKSPRRFYAALDGKIKKPPVYVGMEKIFSDDFGYQYVLHFTTFCDIADWEDVRALSLETAFKIMEENKIKATSGELLPL